MRLEVTPRHPLSVLGAHLGDAHGGASAPLRGDGPAPGGLRAGPGAGVRRSASTWTASATTCTTSTSCPPARRVELTSRSVVETRRRAACAADGDRPDDLLLLPVPGRGRLRRDGGWPSATGRATSNPAAAVEDGAGPARPSAISRDFEYRPLSTTVTHGRGRGAAAAHRRLPGLRSPRIAVARAMGVPTSYVSGYVHAGRGVPPIGASHAWAEAWLPGRGWIGYDATHPVRAGKNHVRVAVGRDYRDAAPTRGVYVGAARGELDVSVEVRPL